MPAREQRPQLTRSPTIREMRATMVRLLSEANNHGVETEIGRLLLRARQQMWLLLDAFLFDEDDWDDDGGRS